MWGKVVGIYTAPRAGAPMERQERVEAVPGLGIVGDRYAEGLGHWSDPRWSDQEITMVEAEVAETLGLRPGDLRRNLVTQGVRLDRLIGVQFRIGEVLLLGVRACDPCRYLEALTRPGLVRALAHRGGLRARIITPGRISVGDILYVEHGPDQQTPVQ